MRISDWSSDVCSSDLLEGPIFLFAGKGCRTVHVDVVDRIHDHAFEAISDDALKLDTVASQFLFGLLEPVVGLGILEIGLMSLDFEQGDNAGFIPDRKSKRLNSSHICASRMKS